LQYLDKFGFPGAVMTPDAEHMAFHPCAKTLVFYNGARSKRVQLRNAELKCVVKLADCFLTWIPTKNVRHKLALEVLTWNRATFSASAKGGQCSDETATAKGRIEP
jgi:hypothetical protein